MKTLLTTHPRAFARPALCAAVLLCPAVHASDALPPNRVVLLQPFDLQCDAALLEIPLRGLQQDVALALDDMPGIAVVAVEPGARREGRRSADAGTSLELKLACAAADRVDYELVASAFPGGTATGRSAGTTSSPLASIRGALVAAAFAVLGRPREQTAAVTPALAPYLAAVDAAPADVALLSRAAGLDSDFRPALTRLGERQLRLGEQGGPDAPAHYAAAETALHHALGVRPDAPRALYALASVYMRTGRTAESIALLARGVERRPDAAMLHAKLGYSLRYAGLFERSISEYRLAQRLDGTHREWIECERQIVKSLIYSGRYAQAAASFAAMRDRLHGLGEVPDEKMLFYQGVGRMYAGDADAAIAYFDASLARGRDSVWADFASAYRAAAIGDTVRLIELADGLESGNVSDGERRYRLAHLNSLANRREKAIEHLELAATSGFFGYPYTKSDALLANLRETAGFRRVLAYIETRHADVAARYR